MQSFNFSIAIFKIPQAGNPKPEYFVSQEDFQRLQRKKILMYLLEQDFIQRRLTKVKKVINSQQEFENLVDFHVKVAQSKVLKHEMRQIKV
jgi:hypothetical protein